MRQNLVIILSMLLLVAVSTSQEYRIKDYTDFEKQVNILEKNKQFEQAIKLTRIVWEQFPEREFDLMKEMIYLNSKTGQSEKNLTLWAAGHQKGYFFLLNTAMKKFEPYLKYDRFKQLVKRDEELRLASFDQSESIYELILPDSFIASKKYALMIILHGGGSNLAKTRSRWKLISEMKSEYIVVFIQSYRHMDSNTFGWTSADERAHRDIERCFKQIVSRYPVDTTHTILCGMSSGATMAFDIVFNRILPTHGIIAFCPGKPWKIDMEKLKVIKPEVFMIGGETDYYLSKQTELVTLFQKYEIPYHYRIIPDMGHEFPPEYENLMHEALGVMQKF
jgi:predicted esterase